MPRRNAYYWKCDVPQALRQRPYAEQPLKATADWHDCALEIAYDHFGRDFLSLEAGPSHNRHLTYLIHCRNATYFFRGDVSQSADDYMLAESYVMSLLRSLEVPVAKVFATDCTRLRWPISYQVIEHIAHPALHVLDQSGQLDRLAIARQLGAYLARIHAVRAPGFGYIDVRTLEDTGQLCGIDTAYADYFLRRLEDHLDELNASKLLAVTEVEKIHGLLLQFLPLIRRPIGCLVHRDLAFWNMLGEAGRLWAIIDWEDTVIGDPADDLGVFNCFYDDATVSALLQTYQQEVDYDDALLTRMWVHTLRNMIWKAALRFRMNYFDSASGAFIASQDSNRSLRDFTVRKIRAAVEYLQELA